MSMKGLKLSDEHDVRKRDKDLENEQATLDLALREIMNLPLGRTWVWWLLEMTHIFSSSFVMAGRDPDSDRRLTDFKLGEQNVGYRILAHLMKVCPNEYVKAISEAGARDERRGN